MAKAIEDTSEVDLFDRDFNTVLNEESTLRNLGSRITASIRKSMLEQPILNIPQSYYRDDNYMVAGGLGTIQDLDEQTKEAIIKASSEYKQQDSVTYLLNMGKDKIWDNIKNNPAFSWLKAQLQRMDKLSGGVCEHVSLAVGESPVLNPPWQFNELDDARSDPQYPHMGRVYFSNIYANFPILIFQPGRAKTHGNFLTFFGKGLFGDHNQMNDYIRSGGDRGFLGTIKYGLTMVKNLALAGAGTAISAITGASFFDASKFITFKPAMPLYRDVTNSLLREFAANLGLLDYSGEKNVSNEPEFDVNDVDKNTEEYKNAVSEMEYDEKQQSEESVKQMGDSNIPEDEESPENPFINTVDKAREKVRDFFDGIGGNVAKFASSYKGSFKKLDVISMIPRSNYADGEESDITSAYQNTSYLPFLCQNTISISETFSNSTSEHPLVSQMNQSSDERRNEKMFPGAQTLLNAIGGITDGGGQDFFNNLKDKLVSSGLKWAGEKVLSASEMGMIMSGGGKMAIPEVWSGSSFSRNYSVDFEFSSPVGDIFSIFENRIMQTCMCVSLVTPLQVGFNAYTAPFMVKVFSKGLFSVDFGIIESLSITHGEEKNDRTFDNFPKTTKVSITVKDLTPTMMLSLGGGAFWKYRRANTAMGEYIATMCNLSISERLDIMRKWKMYWSTLIASAKDSFSLDNIGYKFSQSIFMKPFMAWNVTRINVDKTNKPTQR
ncbi:MAG: hypothetical protein IJ772_05405 [Bacilli bacterium]|nr:hypothetical protein [Bacilli bacterium]